MMEAEVRKKESFEDAMLLALKMYEEATNQKTQVVSRSWKRQGRRFSLEPPKAMLNHSGASDLQSYKINLCC